MSRWTTLVLALMACLIGAVTVLLVRNPGLVRDRQAIAESLLEFEVGLVRFAGEAAALLRPDPPASQAEPVSRPSPVPDSNAIGLASTDPPVGLEAGQPVPRSLDASQAEPAMVPRAEQSDPGGTQTVESGTSAQADDALPRIPSPPGAGGVYFDSNVEGVLVTVDGNRDWRCITPCRLNGIPTGKHTLVAHRSGYGLQRRTIDVTASGLQVEVILSRPEATLVVTSTPEGARVFVDGSDTGKVTNTRVAVRAGQRQVRLVRGALSAEETINVETDELRHLDFRLARR